MRALVGVLALAWVGAASAVDIGYAWGSMPKPVEASGSPSPSPAPSPSPSTPPAAAGPVKARAEELRKSVERLAFVRHRSEPKELEKARTWIEEALGAAGWPVTREAFTTKGSKGVKGVNLRATRKGRTGARTWIVGAHYDTVAGSPGADDNASGVAGLIELAHLLKDLAPQDTVELVAFDLEESLHGGSEALATQLKKDGVEVAGMLSLEMIGYRTERVGSQTLPESLEQGFPDLVRRLASRGQKGDFLALIGDTAATDTVQALVTAGREGGVTMLPIVVGGEALKDSAIRRSDHAAFWDQGFPAVLLTDTADYRSDAYHTTRDVPAVLDYQFMAGIVDAVAAVVRAGAK